MIEDNDDSEGCAEVVIEEDDVQTEEDVAKTKPATENSKGKLPFSVHGYIIKYNSMYVFLISDHNGHSLPSLLPSTQSTTSHSNTSSTTMTDADATTTVAHGVQKMLFMLEVRKITMWLAIFLIFFSAFVLENIWGRIIN